LYAIDPVHASATLIGAYGSSSYITTASPGFDGSGRLWAALDYVPPPSGPVADWSDLAELSIAAGTLTNLGAITPSQPKWAGDLQQIGLKGLAIPSGICAATAAVASTPTLTWYGLIGLFALLALAGGTQARRCHQSV